MTETAAMWLTLGTFNGAIVVLLRYALRSLPLAKVLEDPAAPSPNTSYSRTCGLIGSVVLASLFWAFGNVLLFKSFADIDGAVKLMEGVAPYLTSGATLFLPYAANKLSAAFKS